MVWHFNRRRKALFLSGRGGVPKQTLTEPTLLEMVQWREGFNPNVTPP
jgi:hypothetical protein